MNNLVFIPDTKEDLLKLKSQKKLLPLKFFSIGFNTYFDIKECSGSYILVNRMLSSKETQNFLKIIKSNKDNILGIFFEDIGLVEVLRDIMIEKILFAPHTTTSLKSINAYLKFFTSVVVSTDLSYEAVNKILKNSDKPLCLYSYGHMQLSYSRRTLLSSYNEEYGYNCKNNMEIKNTEYSFIVNENEYGTVIYDKDVMDSKNYEFENVYLEIINLYNIGFENYEKKISTNNGFLDKKLYYKNKSGDKL